MKYFDHVFLLVCLLSDPHYLSTHPTYVLSFSLSLLFTLSLNKQIYNKQNKNHNKLEIMFQNKTKKAHKTIHGVCYVLINCSWTWGLASNVVDIPSVTLLEKTDCPFPRSNQSHRVSWIGMKLCIYFPSSVLGPRVA